MDQRKVKALKDLINNARNLENNYQELIRTFRTQVEICRQDEIVYKEDDVLILVKLFWENGFDKGFQKGLKIY